MTPRISTYVLMCLLGFSTTLPSYAQTQETNPAPFTETPAQRDARTKWFRDAKFGMFIHWGVYSLMGKGEWIMHEEKIQVPEYEKLYPRFNPVRYDPAQWVELAEAAGQKYIVITSKHHDGFCMFDSKLTDYDIMSTPYHKDVIKMLTDECHKRGMRIGFYHSIMDWHHPDYLPRRKWEEKTRPGDKADLNRYLAHMRGQLRELLTNYGEIACIWFDGGWEHKADELHSAEMNAELRRIQPQLLINDRANTPEDFGTPEQYVPATGLTNPDGSPRLWEACITMTSHWWGYDAHETNYKSTTDLIRTLVDVVSKGGNLLLNIGPRPDGTIQKEFVDRLYGIGAWLQVNGESIYSTTASPFRLLPFYGRCTAKGDRLYFHVFGWPADRKLRIPGLENPVTAAWMVPSPESPLEFSRDGDDVIVTLPGKPYDEAASVVAVQLEGEPKVEPIIIRPNASGAIEMPVLWAEVRAQHSQKAHHEMHEGAVIIANWTRTQDYVAWVFQSGKTGEYEVELTYAAPAESAGNKFEVAVGESKITAQIAPTAGPNEFQERTVGRIRCKDGENVLTIKALDPLKGLLMNLRRATLRPAKETNK
jgi:alpha-L-fucosidase